MRSGRGDRARKWAKLECLREGGEGEVYER
jgi:hypothetical protein